MSEGPETQRLRNGHIVAQLSTVAQLGGHLVVWCGAYSLNHSVTETLKPIHFAFFHAQSILHNPVHCDDDVNIYFYLIFIRRSFYVI